jgi:hypothetical protein
VVHRVLITYVIKCGRGLVGVGLKLLQPDSAKPQPTGDCVSIVKANSRKDARILVTITTKTLVHKLLLDAYMMRGGECLKSVGLRR